ncbi:MAG: hypothetical protein AB1341_15590 [Bacillota bacterium]
MKKTVKIMAVSLVLASLLSGPANAISPEERMGLIKPALEEQMRDEPRAQWADDTPISDSDLDFINFSMDLQSYLEQNNFGDVFASMHIDREQNGSEIMILSFTKELTRDKQDEIRALASNPDSILFRVVKYSEKELAQKQMEIDQAWKALEKEGIKIFHSGVNVFINKVEVGIGPYNENSAEKVYQRFGRDMIQVIEGHEAKLLPMSGIKSDAIVLPDGMDIKNETAETMGTAPEEKMGLYQRILQFFETILGWFKK